MDGGRHRPQLFLLVWRMLMDKILIFLFLFQSLTAGLSWDLIALQDIEPGQEVSATFF